MKKTLLKFAGIGLLFVYSFFSGRYLASLFSLSSSSTETAASSEAIENWGLGFQKDGTRPTANATIDELKKYNAHYAADTNKKKIYLTFDCGYENGNTGKILDTLKNHHAKATFFVVGNFITSNPELVKRIHKEGHIVGNHTYHHPDMSKIATKEAFEKELKDVETAYKQLTGEKMTRFYRPPQGKYSISNLKMAKETGYHTFFWSLAYVDWYADKQPTKEEAFKKLLPRIHPGAIVLLHNTSSTNGSILDELLTRWEDMGYHFYSLEEFAAS
ncbi:delta-lactam-biosynthetic de-N-acetylase [Dorea sp. OM07-5]|uniref:polysaccharide deacetylase family protein n=1 Tax=Dorea sp. OM07-5 TaxID=2293100 RepID=UPI000E4A7476|nr:polysaccharide deacetylase family protein [Dorea sp. OM07-5]RHU97007.1 delta-lactam-biosynthetic de-N-acetylase [Dorea sp. OM07-5]